MDTPAPRINQIACAVRRVRWSVASRRCDRCQRPAARVWETTRTAVDIDLDRPVLLAVTVSVHHCRPCRHHFRAQPPFLRPAATYTDRVVQKAVASVYQDGMAVRRVARRLARDFWVRPSEKMVRRWCRAYAAGLDFAGDYQPWVVESFSGVLCVDEVYQGKLALLLAVDPAAPDGDRLVGYQLVHGSVDRAAAEAFLGHLRAAGIVPDQVITDGAAVYPSVLAEVWPAAVHQLCLFHETRRVTAAVDAVAKAVRQALPEPPPAPPLTRGGRLRATPLPAEATGAAAERWRRRAATRRAAIARVQALRGAGWSLSAIARHVGVTRRTARAWAQCAAPGAPEAAAPAGPPAPLAPPPAPWASWDQVQQLRAALTTGRALLLRRPDHLAAEERDRLQMLLASPIGAELRLARRFLEDWYGLWRDEHGRRRAPAAALDRYRAWQADPAYARLAPLRRVRQQVDPARFARLSAFLAAPAWEATNNGAERLGRTFRHVSAPHYTWRTPSSIDDALKVGACLRKHAATAPTRVPATRSSRGRTPRQHATTLAA